LFPRQGIHINRKRDASPNPIVRRTFTRGNLSKGKYIPRHPSFSPDDPGKVGSRRDDSGYVHSVLKIIFLTISKKKV
jgi:hypothetical protein